ncbi:MAG: hypothetical protein ACI843_001318 [Psychrobacter glaciei]|jgi:hypothetical protein
MAITYNNTDLFKFVGFPLVNLNWSWGAVNHEKKQVLLRCWDIEIQKKSVYIFEETDGDERLGQNERRKQLDFVLNDGYELFIAIIDKDKAKSTEAKWVIKNTRQFVMSTDKICIENGKFYTNIIERISLRDFKKQTESQYAAS